MKIDRHMFLRASLLVSVLLAPSLGFSADELFKYNGKTYTSNDLPASARQNLHDLQIETFARTEALAEQAMIDIWLDEQAVVKKKPRAEIEASVFNASDPTPKEIETWYEENKNRLPPGYKLEQISADIKNLLIGEARKKAREKVVADLKNAGTYALLMKEPEAPVFNIDTAGYNSKGSSSAKVTVTEFADYQCPHCKAAKGTLDKLMKTYEGKIRLVFIDFPINPSGISLEVAHGAFCAGKAGKYWQYHDLAYERQNTLDQSSPAALAKDLKLDEKAFDTCMKSEEPKKFVVKSKAEGEKIGISGTPAIFINGRKVKGYDESSLAAEIKKML
jgi:protein-disulfide isomerase